MSADAAGRSRRMAGSMAALWLVTHAQAYGISDVQYAGYQWTALAGSRGWQPDTRSGSRADAVSATSGSILLH